MPFPKTFDNKTSKVNYGIVYRTVQEVVDLMLGYEHYLKQVGFKFDTSHKDLEEIENWTLSAKEFMFWTTPSMGKRSGINTKSLLDKYTLKDNIQRGTIIYMIIFMIIVYYRQTAKDY